MDKTNQLANDLAAWITDRWQRPPSDKEARIEERCAQRATRRAAIEAEDM